MQVQGFRVPTGNVPRVDGKRRPVWYARYRLSDGREVRKKIGPAWTGRGRPAAGYFTKRTAEALLTEILDQARRGTLPGAVQTIALDGLGLSVGGAAWCAGCWGRGRRSWLRAGGWRWVAGRVSVAAACGVRVSVDAGPGSGVGCARLRR
jgi:hypothetical protein